MRDLGHPQLEIGLQNHTVAVLERFASEEVNQFDDGGEFEE
jgi:hypothetical protein